ncbi:MAG: hypothetical protein QOD77_1976 [Thermoplasmata archaeon]|jgi:PAS domain S-box-containing protein|nr:hypothetical protein [Thermoplasmata archaeon]
MLLEAAPDAMVVVDAQGCITFSNQQAEHLFGYGRNESLGRQAEMLLPEWFGPHHPGHWASFLAHPKTRDAGAGLESYARRKDGREFPVEICLSALETEDGRLVLASIHDITDRKKAGDAVRAAAVVEASSDAIISISLDGCITSWNPAAQGMFGYAAEEAIGRSISMLRPAAAKAGQEEAEESFLARVARGEAVPTREAQRVRKDGTALWVSISVSPVRDPLGRVVGAANIKRDVTQRHDIELRIERSLREKEVMLQEIHHRVKNNLQLVASLLNLQADSVEGAKARQLFAHSRNRVRAIGLVHEKLCRSTDMAAIDFQAYVQDLVAQLSALHATDGGVAITVDVEPLEVGIDFAVSCGLILNELVSNSLKHAFPHGRNGGIRITIRHAGPDQVTLEVVDDGVGMAPPVRLASSTGMGFRLVATLTEQLEGHAEFVPGPGTTFRATLRTRRRAQPA